MIDLRLNGDKQPAQFTSAQSEVEELHHELSAIRYVLDKHCLVSVFDSEGVLLQVNDRLVELSGYNQEELIGSSFQRFSHNINQHQLTEVFALLRRGEVWSGRIELLNKSGESSWLESSFVPFLDAEQRVSQVVGVHTDVTQQVLSHAEMVYQAQYDTLTALPNRALLMDRLSQMLRSAKRRNGTVAVLFMDLDDFKKVNDSLGHEVGDELLIEVARRLKAVVREVDTVGRLGGDEFLVLISDFAHIEDVEQVARKIIDTIRRPVLVGDYELVVGVSIGIAFYPEDGDSDSEVLRHADSAMYNSKKVGRNTWSYFTAEMNQEVARRLELESLLNGAIERGEIQVLYQPIVSVASGVFAQVEALVRWYHPQLGHIGPDEFIPVAEQSGYIVELGKFVLHQALDLAASWRQLYQTDLIVAVNVSPRQFRDPNWHDDIENLLSERQLSTRNIEFEITEGVLLSGHEHVQRALDQFSDLGIAISMDDFGTGYSSLSYLRNYPFDTLKIDRSFITDIVQDPADRELVTAAVAMAHGLGLQVIAEGVETAEQRNILKELRCDYAQGWLYCKAVPAAQILDMGGFLPG